MTEQDLYSFDSLLEAAAQSVFTAAGIACAIPLDDAKFQNTRPRVELVFTLGSGKGRYTPGEAIFSGRLWREQAWSGSFRLFVVTEEDPAILRPFLFKVRTVCASLPDSITTAGTLIHHSIYNPIRWTGESAIFRPQDGYFTVSLNFDFDFCINTNAWSQLPVIT